MKDNKNTFKYIAGACFAVLVVLSGISMILNGFYFWNLFPLIGAALIAVSMFVSVPALTAIGSALYGVGAIRTLILYIGYLQDSRFPKRFFIPAILFLVMWVLLLVAGINPKSTKKLGIAAGIIATVRFLFSLISNLIASGSLGLTFTDLALIVGALMIGLSASDNTGKEIPAIATSKTAVVEKNSENQIDRLTKLKSLLDSGVLTQEEFDQKKKQILG